MAAYATTTDVAAWLATTAGALPSNTPRLLARAQELVDAHVRAAYTTDPVTGLPTDAALVAALRDATCAQVERWLADGTDLADVTGPAATETIGRHTVTHSASSQAELTPRARRVLRLAGLAGGKVTAL